MPRYSPFHRTCHRGGTLTLAHGATNGESLPIGGQAERPCAIHDLRCVQRCHRAAVEDDAQEGAHPGAEVSRRCPLLAACSPNMGLITVCRGCRVCVQCGRTQDPAPQPRYTNDDQRQAPPDVPGTLDLTQRIQTHSDSNLRCPVHTQGRDASLPSVGSRAERHTGTSA